MNTFKYPSRGGRYIRTGDSLERLEEAAPPGSPEPEILQSESDTDTPEEVTDHE